MDCYVNCNPSLETIAPHVCTEEFYERRRPLLSMMADRKSLRVLCAPPLFGKSVLAYQYAHIMFAPESILWIDASNPRFLRDIDSQDAHGLMHTIFGALTQGNTCDLLVFDDVPNLKGHRSDCFITAIEMLLSSGCEVVVTTQSPSFLKNMKAHYVMLDAQDMTLDATEIAAYSPGRRSFARSGVSGVGAGVCFPAVLCDNEHGLQRLLISLQHEPVYTNVQAVALTSLILQAGTFSSLNNLVREFASTVPAYFDRYYLYAGMQWRTEVFKSMFLAPEDRLSLLWGHIASLKRHSSFKKEAGYVNALSQELVKLKDYSFLKMVLRFFMTRADQKSFCLNNDVVMPLGTLLEEPLRGSSQRKNKENKGHSSRPVNRLTRVTPSEESFVLPARLRGGHAMQHGAMRHDGTQHEDIQHDGAQYDGAQHEGDSLHHEGMPSEVAYDTPQKTTRETGQTCVCLGEEAMRRVSLAEAGNTNVSDAVIPPDSIARNKAFDDLFDEGALSPHASRELLCQVHQGGGSETTQQVRQGGASDSFGNASQEQGLTQNHDPELVINILGRFEIYRDGVLVASGGAIRKQARLLIALMLVNYEKDISRAWIQRTIWPNVSSQSSRQSFYGLWRHVRLLLTNSNDERLRLGRSRDSISLRGLNLYSDVIELDRLCTTYAAKNSLPTKVSVLRRIRDLHHGPLAPGIDNAQLEVYRQKVLNRVTDVMVMGGKELLKAGNYAEALQWCSYAFQLSPTREDVCFEYMTSLKNTGQYGSAISTFLECRSALVEKFGINASRRLDALYDDILSEVS